jgi:hypothetical protein
MNEFAQAIEDARAEVAEAATEFLPDTCTVSSPGAASTDAYGATAQPPSTTPNVPCKYEAGGVSEGERGGALLATATHVLTLPANVAVEAEDTIVVDARGAAPQLTFQVTGRLDKSTDLLLKVAATLQRKRQS